MLGQRGIGCLKNLISQMKIDPSHTSAGFMAFYLGPKGTTLVTDNDEGHDMRNECDVFVFN